MKNVAMIDDRDEEKANMTSIFYIYSIDLDCNKAFHYENLDL